MQNKEFFIIVAILQVFCLSMLTFFVFHMERVAFHLLLVLLLVDVCAIILDRKFHLFELTFVRVSFYLLPLFLILGYGAIINYLHWR